MIGNVAEDRGAQAPSPLLDNETMVLQLITRPNLLISWLQAFVLTYSLFAPSTAYKTPLPLERLATDHRPCRRTCCTANWPPTHAAITFVLQEEGLDSCLINAGPKTAAGAVVIIDRALQRPSLRLQAIEGILLTASHRHHKRSEVACLLFAPVTCHSAVIREPAAKDRTACMENNR